MKISSSTQGKLAVINIGSNSVKLFVPSLGRFGYRKVVTSRLAAHSSDGGRTLELGSMKRTFDAVSELVREAEEKNASDIFVYATEALRSASNGHILTDRIKSELKIDVDVISGKQEAEIAAAGASLSFPDCDAFADIGGASTEIALRRGEKLEYASYPVGAVRLDEAGTDVDFLEKQAEAALKISGAAKHIVGMGGTFSALACISLGLDAFDESAVHGAVLSFAELERLRGVLKPLTPGEITERYPAVTSLRAKVIKAGLAITCAVANLTKADDITVSLDDGLKGYALLLTQQEKI